MIDVVRFDHVSMAVPELDPQIELLEALFGFRYAGRFEEAGLVGANLDVPGRSGVSWEVIAPDGPDSYLHRFLDGPQGAGIHHLTIQVRDFAQATAAMRAEGIEPWGGRSEGGDGDEALPPEGGAAEGVSEAETAWRDGGPEASPSTGAPVGAPAREVAYIHPRRGGHGFLFQLYAGEPWRVPEPFDDDREHTLGIIAINHLAHAYPDRMELADWYVRLFGMTLVHAPPESVVPPASGFRTAVVEASTGQLRIEVIVPAGPDSFIQRFLDRRGPSIHHVTFEVADWDRAVAACEHHGVSTFGEREGETRGVTWREAFVHPRDTGGVLVQFFWQAEPGVWI